jgi:hypothetical protein
MHREFDIAYINPPWQNAAWSITGAASRSIKNDIVEKIPNLRKVSITPWADVNVAAEAIEKKYVLSYKPNPASVAVNPLDRDNLKQEITTILEACSRNGCSCELVLKDISTCCGRPQNIFEWEQTVMELVQS